MIICLLQAGIGALIAAMWDDGDENTVVMSGDDANELMDNIASLTRTINRKFPDVNVFQAHKLASAILSDPDFRSKPQFEQNMIIGRSVQILYDKNYAATKAEINSVVSRYQLGQSDDSTTDEKRFQIYNDIDPSGDGDAETDDAFSFETEIENLFSLEPIAISHEDIQAETDIIDPSSVDPIDEITVDEEISVDDTTTGVFSEVSVTEETYFQEAVIYPDVGDEDLDRTNDVEELFAPEDEYRPQEEIEGRIEFMEQVLDDAIENLDANTFEAHARTFYQDDSEPLMMEDDVYFPEDINNSGVIDFSNLLDDVGGIVTDSVDDTFNDPFLQWLESPGSESLDIDPAPGFMSPYGVLGGF